jgi:hypothetical protein
MLKLLGLGRDEDAQLPAEDALCPAAHLKRGRAVFQAHAGAPYQADALAYEPVQRLLAVRAPSVCGRTHKGPVARASCLKPAAAHCHRCAAASCRSAHQMGA